MQGLILVISGPSGAGKTTLCQNLLESTENLKYSISVTARSPRGDEANGVDYYFVNEQEFEQMVMEEKFAEWAKVHGNYYGTKREFLEKSISDGSDILLDIDVQGGIKIKEKYPEAVLIYVVPHSLEELEDRLRNRGVDSEETIKRRLLNVRREINYLPKYDYLIFTEGIEKSLEKAKVIITAERNRVKRIPLCIYERFGIKQEKEGGGVKE